MTPAHGTVDVITPLGRLWGRDTIFLDTIAIDYKGPRRLVLGGAINGAHVDPPRRDEDLTFQLAFDHLLGLRMTALDFAAPTGTFVEVIDSPWIAEMRRRDSAAKVRPEHRHFRVMTYDDVFEVVSTGYMLTLARPAGAPAQPTS